MPNFLVFHCYPHGDSGRNAVLPLKNLGIDIAQPAIFSPQSVSEAELKNWSMFSVYFIMDICDSLP